MIRSRGARLRPGPFLLLAALVLGSVPGCRQTPPPAGAGAPRVSVRLEAATYDPVDDVYRLNLRLRREGGGPWTGVRVVEASLLEPGRPGAITLEPGNGCYLESISSTGRPLPEELSVSLVDEGFLPHLRRPVVAVQLEWNGAERVTYLLSAATGRS